MNVHLYISSPNADDEPFLRYDAKVVVEGDGNGEGDFKARLPQAVVKHYIQRLLNGKEVPFIIEEYLELQFHEEQTGGGGGGGRSEAYLSEMSLDDYHRMLRRIARNVDECACVFRAWTEVADNHDVLVCVAESDLSAPFIMGLFPPVEMFTRTVTAGGGGGEDDGSGEEEEEE
jgi:hypothetical protein